MLVTMLVHLEATDDSTTWWAESPEVPGFSAFANSMDELRHKFSTAVESILGTDVELRQRLAS